MELSLATAPSPSTRCSRSAERWTSTPRRGCGNGWSSWSTAVPAASWSTCGRVDFLDSTGLGVLVGALKRLRPRAAPSCWCVRKEPMLKIFRITALDQVFPIVDTVEAAVVIDDAVDTDTGSLPATAPGGPAGDRRYRRRRTVSSGSADGDGSVSFSPAPVHVRTARLVGVAVARRAGRGRGAARRGAPADR